MVQQYCHGEIEWKEHHRDLPLIVTRKSTYNLWWVGHPTLVAASMLGYWSNRAVLGGDRDSQSDGQWQPPINERGPKPRVTKAVMEKRYRFRSFAISIYMVPFISTSTIGALDGQQSAVHCLSSKRGRNFPQTSLVFALSRFFCRFCSSLWIKVLFNGRFQSRPGWTTPSRCFKTLMRNWSAPLQGWIGTLAVLVIATLSRFGYR